MGVDTARPTRRGLRRAAGVMVLAVGLAALAAWVRARRAGPDWRTIGGAIAAGRWAEAEGSLVERLAREPGDSTAWMKLGGVRAAMGRDGAAIEAFERVRGSNRARAVAATQIGELRLKQRRLAEAE
ncbi:MAG TPA: hypothetical protein VG406_08330, partial [Isosphaeraceae bacterium]|nr:hypothetical protein [Isosphaeraceae bacterium]